MKHFVSIFASILIAILPAYSFAEINSLSEAINKAGRQRMLGQRIVKNYLMIGSDIKTAKAQKELDDAIALFEEQHIELVDYAPSEEIETSLSNVSQLWNNFRLKAISEPQLHAGQELIKQSNELFTASNKVVSLLEAHSGTSKAKLVNISGKQRMLSQKIAKLYMGMYWRVNIANIETEFNNTIAQFEQGLMTLIKAQENTQVLNKKLRKVKAQWDFSKAGFSQYQNGRFVPTVISVTTESMLNKMDEITLLYQQLEQNRQDK